ncbi:hypothetical protein ACSZNT_14890 [Aeromonas veronii]|uniref:hypothetical protein n=1 Tax=Aeromonas veronii TaxID=654 RepID=UPI0029373F2B|nr:hypothetical protein [Aeromonas veronii]WOE85837.1 hypothetical protein RY930_05425 [Aeromonas veronii]
MGKQQKGKSQRQAKKNAKKTAQVEVQVEPSEKECTAVPISIDSITVDYEKCQCRTSMSRVSISDYRSLILKNVKWHSLIHIGLYKDKRYLLDAGLTPEEAKTRAYSTLKQFQMSKEAGEGFPVDKSLV